MTNKDTLEVIVPYKPRPLQMELHKSLKRFNVIVCHRRFGKSVFAVNELIAKAVSCKVENGRFAYIGPTFRQTKDIIWKYVKQYTAPIPYMKYNETECSATFPNGVSLRLYGTENADALRGMFLNGVVIDEVGDIPKHVWPEIIRPMLIDYKGWAIFIGTPKGENIFYDLYMHAGYAQNWFQATYKASKTGILPPEELEDARRTSTEASYNQEYECSFSAPVRGAYYAELLDTADKEGRIGEALWNQSYPVITAWDIGLADKTCIWFAQIIHGTIFVIDYYENNDQTLAFYATVVKSKPYTYDYHIMPHDVTQRSIDTGRTRLHQLKRLGLKCEVAPKTLKLDGINSVRTILSRCRFNSETCKEGLRALRHYRATYDVINDCFRDDRPVHDWSSDASDAFRYLAAGFKDKNMIRLSPYGHISIFERQPVELKTDNDWDIHDYE